MTSTISILLSKIVLEMAHLASAAGAASADYDTLHFEDEAPAEVIPAPGLSSAPIVIPECVRKPKPRTIVPKKPNKRRGRKKKESDTMSREELLTYFTNLQYDPNFSILPFPRFVQESNPELFAGESEANFKERMKRIDYLEALDAAETEEEKEAIKAKRAEELKTQVVPAYQRIPVDKPASLKG